MMGTMRKSFECIDGSDPIGWSFFYVFVLHSECVYFVLALRWRLGCSICRRFT